MELDSIYEEVLNYHINDYIIFEASLRRDYYEVNGILTEDGNKNFLKTIWEKILKAVQKIKKKIVEFFKNIRNKLFYNKKKLKEIRNKYMGYYSNEKAFDLLKDFTIDNFKAFRCDIILTKLVSYDNKMFDFKNDISDEKLQEIENKVNDTKKIREDIHNKIWITDKKITKPFKEIEGVFTYIAKNLDRNMEGYEAALIEKEKEYVNFLKEYEKRTQNDLKDYEKFSKEYPGDYDTKIKEAQNTLKALPLLETLMFKEITVLIEESKDLFVASIKLYVAGGKYLQKKLGKKPKNESYIDMDYINAVTEAEIYELELL